MQEATGDGTCRVAPGSSPQAPPAPGRALAAAAVAGALWPLVLAVGGMFVDRLFWRAYAHDLRDVAFFGLLAAAVPVVASLPAAALLRRWRVPRAKAAAAAGLLLACPAVTWALWRAWVPREAAVFLGGLALSAGVFTLVVRLARHRVWLRGIAGGSAAALLVLAGAQTADFVGGLRAETAADVDSVGGAIAVLDHPGWRLREVWANEHHVELVYRARGAPRRALQVTSRTGPDYQHSRSPCVDTPSGSCERHEAGWLHRLGDGGPALVVPAPGASVRIEPPYWAPAASETALLDAGAHLRSATPAEQRKLERLAFRNLLHLETPGIPDDVLPAEDGTGR